MEKEIKKHFCTCGDLDCSLNPNNPNSPDNPNNSDNQIPSCDPCIRKNLKAGEIPSCFFHLVKEDLSDVEDFSIEGFVAFYQKYNQESNLPSNQPTNCKSDKGQV